MPWWGWLVIIWLPIALVIAIPMGMYIGQMSARNYPPVPPPDPAPPRPPQPPASER